MSVGAEYRLGGDWQASAWIAYGRDLSDGHVTNQINSTFLNEALGRTADNPATPFSTARDGFFNPFGDGSVNSDAIIAFIRAGRSNTVLEAEVTSANWQLDGTVLSLPGGPVKLAVGLNVRREEQGQNGFSFSSGLAPTPFTPRKDQREVRAAFVETRVPLFGAANRRPGLERLELSLAARLEDYDDIGATTNPKVGLLWSPLPEWTTRASWGTSFRAPALLELRERAVNGPTILPRGTQQTVSMIQYGGNPDLEPEEAESWTAGLEYRPAARPGSRIALNWFRTTFDRRIGQPALENILGALSDPSLSPFIRFIAPATSAADRALIQDILSSANTFSSGLFPIESYGAIVDARYVNTNSLEVEGLDLTGQLRFQRGADAFTLSGNVSKLLRFELQATPTSTVIDRVSTPNQPVGLRGRASGDWSRGPIGAGLSVNYVDAYRDLAGRRIEAWVTTDLQVRYAVQEGPLTGIEAALSIQNLFDEDPPFYDAPQGIAYDAANANVLGRFIALQVTRRW